jgi:uncharacterized membrane protein
MADKDKYSFVVVKYPAKDTAEAALDAVTQASKDKVVKLVDAVAITKTEKGKVKIHQTKDDAGWQGFLKGGLIGLVFSLLFGPPGWVAAGAIVGTFVGWADKGVKNKLLKEIGEDMTPEESALAVLIKKADWAELDKRVKAAGFAGEEIKTEISEEHMAELQAMVDKPEVSEAVSEEVEVTE